MASVVHGRTGRALGRAAWAVALGGLAGWSWAQAGGASPADDVAAGSAEAAVAPAGWEFASLSLLWDNDGTYIKPFGASDRHYTNGVKLDLAWTPPDDAAWLDKWIPADRWPDAKVAAGLVIAQHIYTASDITDFDPPEGDHPYSGYLYVGGYLQRASGRVHDHLELDLGVVGQYAGGEVTQKFIHAAFPGQDRPNGWPTQLANEFAVNVRGQRSWRTERADLSGGNGSVLLDAVPRVSADLGNVFVRGSADLTLRVGRLPDDFGPPRLLDTRDATGSWELPGDWGWYLFARGGVRAYARNIFLDGNTFADSRSADKRALVGELEVGLTVRYRAAEFRYSATWLTEEFEDQNGNNAYASIGLVLRF